MVINFTFNVIVWILIGMSHMIIDFCMCEEQLMGYNGRGESRAAYKRLSALFQVYLVLLLLLKNVDDFSLICDCSFHKCDTWTDSVTGILQI